MKLLPFKNCLRDLNFQPVKMCAKREVPIAWSKYLITGFDSQESNCLSYSESDSFLEIFKSYYNKLSISEIARIFLNWPDSSQLGFSWEEFFSAYNIKYSKQSLKYFKLIAKSPINFQNWLSKKSAQMSDISILNCFSENLEDLFFVMNIITKKQMSLQEGLQILEKSGELLLIGRKPEEIQSVFNTQNREEILKKLSQLKNPQFYNLELKKEEELKKLPFPKEVQAKWRRQNDKTGIELKLFLSSKQDLKNKFSKLKNLQTDLEKEDLWS